VAVPDLSPFDVGVGELPTAAKQNGLITAVQNSLNNIGNPAYTTFASGQILAPSQISQGGATTKQGLVWSGTAWAPASLAAITVKTGSGVAVTNTITETDLFTGTTGTGYLVIPAGSLTATGGIRIVGGGLYTNSSGSSRTIRMKLRVGASSGLPAFTTFTTPWDSGVSDTITSNANNRAWTFDLQLQALNATNSQAWSGDFFMSSATPPTTGLGPLSAPSNASLAAPITPTTGSVDFAADVGIALSVIHSAAVSSITMQLGYVRIEVSS